MSTRAPKYNSDINAWMTLNNFFQPFTDIPDIIKIKQNGNNPPTVETNTKFIVFKEATDTIASTDFDSSPIVATGNNEYIKGKVIDYLVSEAIYEQTDQVFAWSAGLFPVQSDGLWSLYCTGSLDQDETTIGQGLYGAELGPPVYDEEKGGYYRSSKKVIAMFRSTAGTVSDIVPLSNTSRAYDNDIIDGLFMLSQSPEAINGVTGVASGGHLCDMLKYSKNGTMVIDSSIDIGVAPTPGTGALRVDVTTAQASIGAGDYSIISYFIEGYEIPKYYDKGFLTFNLKVYSSKTGTMCIAIRNQGPNRSYITEITIDTANTMEEKTIRIPFTEKGGTWDYTNDVGISIDIVLAAGVTYQGTKDTWLTGNKFATSSQSNFVDSAINIIELTALSCVPGAKKYDWGNYNRDHDKDKELRYAEKSHFETATGDLTALGNHYVSTATNTANIFAAVGYRKEKRTGAPNIIFNQADPTGAAGLWSYFNAGTVLYVPTSAMAAITKTSMGFIARGTLVASFVANDSYLMVGEYFADDRL